ncbi:MAG: DUF456 family protein [Alysiella sp.]|uniref:DUF456 domain-containing protein n=1 Tax=Alysiella sp. TaxID=1872483 RepID=UPI0026DA7B52|nr:DUF456 family protein [Alysiella sp.]MDO4433909.1 DUF456 family protein [Alysiella sp.]
MTVFLVILALILLLAGAAGTVFPALPGLPLMFGGVWLLAYTSDYQIIGSLSLWILGLVCVFGMAMDFITSLLGAKYTGASQTALWGTFIGGLVGMFFGIVGLVLGPLLGAAAGEFMNKRSLFNAGKVGIGTFIGFIIGTVAKIGSALVVLLVVLAQYLTYWLS